MQLPTDGAHARSTYFDWYIWGYHRLKPRMVRHDTPLLRAGIYNRVWYTSRLKIPRQWFSLMIRYEISKVQRRWVHVSMDQERSTCPVAHAANSYWRIRVECVLKVMYRIPGRYFWTRTRFRSSTLARSCNHWQYMYINITAILTTVTMYRTSASTRGDADQIRPVWKSIVDSTMRTIDDTIRNTTTEMPLFSHGRVATTIRFLLHCRHLLVLRTPVNCFNNVMHWFSQ